MNPMRRGGIEESTTVKINIAQSIEFPMARLKFRKTGQLLHILEPQVDWMLIIM